MPVTRQRLIFRGRLLKDDEVLEAIGLREGNVLHMIASLEPERNTVSEEDPNTSLMRAGSSSSRSPQNTNNLSTALENGVIADMLGTLGKPGFTVADQTLNRRNQQCRAVQQRTNGFNISTKESLLIINQNLETLTQFKDTAIELKPDQTTVNPSAFDLNKRVLKLGQWIDVKDTVNQWVIPV